MRGIGVPLKVERDVRFLLLNKVALPHLKSTFAMKKMSIK